MALELDYMEYANHALIRAAYANIDNSHTKLLLHCNGADESQVFSDESPSARTITVTGNAQVDTAQKKFGTGSALFDGIGSRLSALDSDDWNFGSGNFTIDFWVRFNTVIATQTMWGHGANSSNRTLFEWSKVPSPDGFYFQSKSGGGHVFTAIDWSFTPVADTWYHVALVREGTTLHLYVDGTEIGGGAAFDYTLPDQSGTFAIGMNPYSTGAPFDGWIDEFRVSKDIARWTENFVKPSIEYLPLQCYSESGTKEQGSYSLKGTAKQTDSLNDTLTRTIGSPIDLSDRDTIKFDIYSSRTGAHIKVGIRDSGSVWTEKTYTIIQANTWETVTWDISGVGNANKDAIDRIKITILNADAENTFYIDNMYAEDVSILTNALFFGSNF